MKKNRCDSRRFWDRRSRIYDAQVIPEYKGTYKKIVKRSAHFLVKKTGSWRSDAVQETLPFHWPVM